MNDEMIQHASRFDFPNSSGISNTIILERILDFDENYHWIIRLGGSRWSKNYQVFRYRNDEETADEYDEDTQYSLDEAFKIANTRNLYAEHIKRLDEPNGIPPTYQVGSTVYELDKAFVRDVSPDIKTNDVLAKERADKLKGRGYQVFILIGSRGNMVFDAVYKVKTQRKQQQKVSQSL